MKVRNGFYTLVILTILALTGAYATYIWLDEAPDDLLRYVERRLLGHPKLETGLMPLVKWTREQLVSPSRALVTSHSCLHSAERHKHMAAIPAAELPRQHRVVRSGSVIRVGPHHKINRIADAARVAKNGDVVEIEAGEYLNDVASWTQNDLQIRGVGGRVRIISTGPIAEGKAIWVIHGDNILIENVGFSGARAHDLNGAGIRHQGKKLTVRDSFFEGNEMGIITWNNDATELRVIRSEFCGNATAEQHKLTDPGHQIYVGAIARFELRDSYIHHGAFGHLVKSRARENHIYNNRLTDEINGRASYELEFPNGGLAYVVGNIIQQSTWTDNGKIIFYGAEGYRWPQNELYIVNNTLVDERAMGGRFLTVRPGPVRLKVINNLILGKRSRYGAIPGDSSANHTASWSDVAFAQREDYRLKVGSSLLGKALDPGFANGLPLAPKREYVHPLNSRPLEGAPVLPGALQQLAPATH